jgi:hypothetical protein
MAGLGQIAGAGGAGLPLEIMMKMRWLALLAAVGLAYHATAQDRKESLIALTKIAASYRVTLAPTRVAKLNEEPVIRWTKPAGEIEDAALFVWTCEDRPVVAATFLWQKNIGLYHEFQSLSLEPLKAERHGESVWVTTKPGIKFAPVPDAPVPADTRNKRLVQMKALADEFRSEAIKGPPYYTENSVYKFRLLPKPLLSYHERPERDGAIFAFVQDTDPEVLLVLENRAHGDGTRWEFAIAPMTGWPLSAWHKALKVWSIGRRHPGNDPTQTYFVAGPFNEEGRHK